MAIDLKANLYTQLMQHVDHEIECVTYGDDDNVAIECVTCGSVLLTDDKPGPWMCPDCGLVWTDGTQSCDSPDCHRDADA